MLMKKKKLKIQSLIFNKKYFRTKSEVKSWLNRNGYKVLKYKSKPITKYKNTFRVRQRYPSKFNKRSFRTVNIKKGVKAVKGYLK